MTYLRREYVTVGLIGFPAILRTIVQIFLSTTIDFGYRRLPRLAPGGFYSRPTPGFGPDDTKVLYVSRSGTPFYFLSSFSPVADDFPALIVKRNRVAFFGTRFAFWYGTICYVDESVGEMSDRIFQIVWADLADPALRMV